MSTFNKLGLAESVVQSVHDSGYSTPTNIQQEIIPFIIKGRDVVGQAQTGTGKTAAFALPLLSKLNLMAPYTQVLVLTPTRELAIQVAAAFEKYAANMDGFQVAAIYGGQSYTIQLQALKRGPHVVVGTTGRVMDHIRRNSLDISNIACLVLDEADEMLRMGFVEDIEWILEQSPPNRQISLFSATMPAPIKRIAARYLTDPKKITIQASNQDKKNIAQYYLPIRSLTKLEALQRVIAAEQCDGTIIFVRTKGATLDVADKLAASGHKIAAINGDMQQRDRERTIEHLKSGKIDIIVATDVAARGLDVERISHVINYDMPHNSETYIHRIGRTGRAGRNGKAILFINAKEKKLIHILEKAINCRIQETEMPSLETILAKHKEQLLQQVSNVIAKSKKLAELSTIVDNFTSEHEVSATTMAAALIKLLQDKMPLPVATTSTTTKLRVKKCAPARSRGDRKYAPKDTKSAPARSRGDRKYAPKDTNGKKPRRANSETTRTHKPKSKKFNEKKASPSKSRRGKDSKRPAGKPKGRSR